MKQILFCLSLTLLISSVIGLKCYVCNSVNDMSKCGHGSDADSSFLKDCDDESLKTILPPLPTNRTWELCRKMVTTVDFDVNGNKANERIKRSCGWYTDEEKYNTECYYRGGLGGRITTCSCKENGCNTATNTQISSLAFLTTLFGAFLAKFL